MKNKNYKIVMSFILIILIFISGCSKKEYTKEEVYDQYQKQISKISSYTCNTKLQVIGNKERSIYTFKQTYKKPNNYVLELKSPENLKGKKIIYKDDKIILENPDIKDAVEILNINEDGHYLFIGDFITNYIGNKDINIDTNENEIKIEVEIPDKNKYFNKQILYIDKESKCPVKMDILDNEGRPKFIVTYENFKYKK